MKRPLSDQEKHVLKRVQFHISQAQMALIGLSRKKPRLRVAREHMDRHLDNAHFEAQFNLELR